MIVSPGRGYVFVHIPKTGGTSLALALEERAGDDDILIGDTPLAKQRKKQLRGVTAAGRLWKHSSLTDIDGLVSLEDLQQMLCFTIVRNPWDRLVSYYHWLQEQTFHHQAVVLSRELDFDQFVSHPHTGHSLTAWPYERYMTDASGRVRADLFLRLEHLEQDLEPLHSHLGFTLEMPHVNRSDRSDDYRSYYTKHTAALVGRICARDVARFGYRFDA